MTIKLVDTTDTRDWFERLQIPREITERRKRYAGMAKQVADAVEALDPEEYAEVIEYMNLSQQDVTEICKSLDASIRSAEYRNNQAIKYLRSLKPTRIWAGKR